MQVSTKVIARESYLISIVIPAYNESKKIIDSLTNVQAVLQDITSDYEILVVDDGSTDGLSNIISINGHKKIRCLRYNVNMGKGFALKYGACLAKGKYVIFIDADSEINPRLLNAYLSELAYSDLAIASKWHPKSSIKVSPIRRYLSLSFKLLVKILTGLSVSDSQAGLKACRITSLRKILPLLSVKKYAFDVEFLVIANLLKLKIRELPVEIDLTGQFKIRHILRMLIDILGIAYRLRILKWYQGNLNNKNPLYKPKLDW